METKIKKASTFYVHSHRKSEDVITSPKNEDQKFIDLSPNPRKKNQLKYITKTHLQEMKKSRQQALQEQLKRLNSKRRLLKIFRRVFLISMFLTIAKQCESKKIYGNHKHKVYRWLILPEDRIKLFWDLFMMIVLVYSSIYIPFVAAFEDDERVYNISRYVFTVVYVTDIILLTRMCYYDEYNNLVQDQYQIIKNYLRGWFLIDAISVIPQPLFQLSKVLRIQRVQKIISSSSLNQNKILDFLIRQLDLKQASLLQILFFSAIGFHYAACLWGLSVQFSRKKIPSYIDAVYWAIQTISTTGYGDCTPTSMIEYLTTVLVTLCGGIFMSLVIGNLGSILTDLDAETQINEIMNKFKALFNQFVILPEFRSGIQNYIHTNHRYNLTWSLKSQEWFKSLPLNFQNKILLKATEHELQSISFFRISIPFSLKVVRYMSLMKISAGNMVWYKGDPAEEIYFLVDGLILYKNKFGKELLKIQRGAIFGEQEFFSGRKVAQGQIQRINYAYVKEDSCFIIIRSSHFFHYIEEFPALKKYLQMLVEHRKGDMLIRFKEYEMLAEKERISSQKLEFIKSANRIDVKDYQKQHKQSVIYDTRQSNTEQILDRILKNRQSKISILFERFRKVVQMIIFANRTLDTKIIMTKNAQPTTLLVKENQLFQKVKPNQIVPVGVLVKMRQKVIDKRNMNIFRKIHLSKQNEFQKIIQCFSNQKGRMISNQRKNTENIQEKMKKLIIDYHPNNELREKLLQIHSIEKNLNLSIWLAKENQKDLDQELNSINRLFEKVDLGKCKINF